MNGNNNENGGGQQQDEEQAMLIQQDGAAGEGKGQPPTSSKKGEPIDERLPEMNYESLNGLRGFGALAVYLGHFFIFFFPTKDEIDEQHDSTEPPSWIRYARMTPLVIFIHGYFWVIVFFILSGFVLPLSYFKTKKPSCLYGGAIRRYPRLMLPVFITISIYYAVVKFGVTDKNAFPAIKRKNFGLLLLDGLIGTWFGNNDYTVVTWSLSIELWATFLIYLVAFVTIEYRWRYSIYIGLFIILWSPLVTDAYKITDYHLGNHQNKFVEHLPMFFIGTLLSDMEFNFKTWRPLDYIRRWNIWWSILRNLVLLFLFFTYGSYVGRSSCEAVREGNCRYWEITTFNWNLPKDFCGYIGAIAIVLLALVSETFQIILLTPPIQFMGRISYTFYLIHLLILEWAMASTARKWTQDNPEEEFTRNDAALYVFLIYTPIIIIISWLMEMAIDAPSKNLAGEIDRELRLERPKDKNGKPRKPKSCCQFVWTNWKVWSIPIWLLTLFLATEIFGFVDQDTANRVYQEGSPLPSER